MKERINQLAHGAVQYEKPMITVTQSSIQDTVQVSVTPNIMNTNVLVEKEQSLKNMTIFRALEIIVYIFTVTYAVGSTLLILLLE